MRIQTQVRSQVVLDFFRKEPQAPLQTCVDPRIVKALDYFAVPENAWPTAYVLLKHLQGQRWMYERKDEGTAQDMVGQILQLAQKHLPYGRPACVGEDLQYSGLFWIEKVDVAGERLLLATTTLDDPVSETVSGFPLEAELQAAVIKAGKAELLNIRFDDQVDCQPSQHHIIVSLSYKDDSPSKLQVKTAQPIDSDLKLLARKRCLRLLPACLISALWLLGSALRARGFW